MAAWSADRDADLKRDPDGKRSGEPNRWFADLHIHIGRTERGETVKISASRDLTLRRIAREAALRKGIGLIGIIDGHSPGVLEDFARCLDAGEMEEADGGGIRYRDTTILLGSEIEVRDEGYAPVHVLCYLPDYEAMRDFSRWLSGRMANVRLSSQRVRVPARVLQREVVGRGGIFLPAHAFTPHKGLYGTCSRLSELLDPDLVHAVELGLSADTEMASRLSELDPYPFLSNSDAHSPGKIGREYNLLRMRHPCFAEFRLALEGAGGRGIEANFGLHPRLGKYHRTFCEACDAILDGTAASSDRCPRCGSTRIVRGVLDRIRSIADRTEASPVPARPPYRRQVPLEFLPGVGRRTLDRLLDHFGTEMNVLHRVPVAELEKVCGERIAGLIGAMREGRLAFEAGGGGIYGRVGGPES